MAGISDVEVSQMLNSFSRSTAHLRLNHSGAVDVQIDNPGIGPISVPGTVNITTTATECAWNLYSTAKLPNSTQTSNRARLVESTSDGQIFRIGSAIFLPQSSSPSDTFKSFTVPKMSLYIDNIQQHGRYLFVTSRQDISTTPEPKDEPVKGAGANSSDADPKSNGLEKGTDKTSPVGAELSTASGDTATKDKPNEETEDSSDDDDSADKIPQPSDDGSSNELSADESWSEGSTEYDSDQKLPDFNPRMPQQEKLKIGSDSESSDLESNLESAASNDSDMEENLLEGSDKEGAAMSSDEEDRLFVAIFNDGDRPQYDEEDERSEVDLEDDDYPEFASSDFDNDDWNQPPGSDSEECSECGDDGGACAMPPKDTRIALESEQDQEAEEPVGASVAHIHVYDTSVTTNDQDDPKRIFHFKRPTGQILAASPPAIHPTKSLAVWPLGDGKILFADYEYNTYFVRKFRTSRFWSSHVSINCHFSDDGKCLHIVALEKSGRPPTLPTRKSKAKSKSKEDLPKPKKETPKYELIVSTYRLSDAKTTRAPPTLMRRVQRDLGELDVLPSILWGDNQVYISSTKRTTGHVYRVDLHNMSTTKTKRSKEDKMVICCFTINLPEWATDREMQYMPSDSGSNEGHIIVAGVATRIPLYKSVTTKDSAIAEKPMIVHDQSIVDAKVCFRSSNTAKAETDVPADNCGNVADAPVNSTMKNDSHHADTSIAATKPECSQPGKTTDEIKEVPKSAYPNTMVARLSRDVIEISGGWRDTSDIGSGTADLAGNENKIVEVDLLFESIAGITT